MGGECGYHVRMRTHALPVHVGGAPAAKVWKPVAHVPAEQVEPSHAVQSEVEVSVYVVEQAVHVGA